MEGEASAAVGALRPKPFAPSPSPQALRPKPFAPKPFGPKPFAPHHFTFSFFNFFSLLLFNSLICLLDFSILLFYSFTLLPLDSLILLLIFQDVFECSSVICFILIHFSLFSLYSIFLFSFFFFFLILFHLFHFVSVFFQIFLIIILFYLICSIFFFCAEIRHHNARGKSSFCVRDHATICCARCSHPVQYGIDKVMVKGCRGPRSLFSEISLGTITSLLSLHRSRRSPLGGLGPRSASRTAVAS